MIGAGFMAQGLVNQIVNSVPGMGVAAIYGRRLERAREVYEYAGPRGRAVVDDAVRARGCRRAPARPVITDDPTLLCRSEQIDALVDVTGSVEFGAHVVLEAFRHGKHVILMNAELDATIGPILQRLRGARTASSSRPATATSPACR